MKPQRESFIFYKAFYEAISELPLKEQGFMYKSIAEYVIFYKTPTINGIKKAIWLLIKPQLDANIKKYKAGKKFGNLGAVHGLKGGRPGTTAKPSRNPQETLKKPSRNPQETLKKPSNVNVNDNVNDNVNTDLKKIVDFYNETFNKSIRSYSGFEKNFYHWVEIHDVGKIKQAITIASIDKFWKDKLTLQILFRQKNPQGEDVDYIEDLSNRNAPVEEKKRTEFEELNDLDFSKMV